MIKIINIISVVVLFFLQNGYPQSFERIYPSPDTLAFPDKILTLNDGNILVLNNAAIPVPFDGFLIGGYRTYGSTLTKITPNGDIIWRNTYFTNNGNYSSWPFTNHPTEFVLELTSGEIFLPFTIDAGFLQCEGDTNSVSESNKLMAYWIEPESGEIINSHAFTEEFCTREHIRGVYQDEDENIHIAIHDWRTYTSSIFSFDKSINSVSRTFLPTNTELYNQSVREGDVYTFIGFDWEDNDEFLYKISNDGEIIWRISIPDVFLTYRDLQLTSNDEYAMFTHYDNRADDNLINHSKIFYYDTNGNFLDSFLIEEKRIYSAELLADNQYLILFSSRAEATYRQNGVAVIDYTGKVLKQHFFTLDCPLVPKDMTLYKRDGFAATGNCVVPKPAGLGGIDSSSLVVIKGEINDLVSSLKDEHPEETVNVYPNPTPNDVQIQTTFSYQQLTLYDSIGKVVVKRSLSPFSTTANLSFQTLPKGIYFLELADDQKNRKVTKKIVKY